MKYLLGILFLTFTLGSQTDSVKVDTAIQHQVQEDINHINNDLDSIIAILKDTTFNKKQKR